MLIVDPTRGRHDRVASSGTDSLNARLSGRVCLVSNGKPNASELLSGVAAAIETLHAAPVFAKPSASVPASADLLDRVAGGFDAVLMAVGD